MTDFPRFVESILKQKNMKPADLARQANIDTGLLSRVLSYERGAGPETVIAIARGLGVETEDAFRAMGWLPEKQNADPRQDRLVYLFNQLASSDKDELIQIAEIKLQYKVIRSLTDELAEQLKIIPQEQKGAVVLDWLRRIGVEVKERR